MSAIGTRAVQRLAAALGCTEGQAYTAAIGVLVAVALSVTGLPGGLRGLPSTFAATAPQVRTVDTSPTAGAPEADTPPARSGAPVAPSPAASGGPAVPGGGASTVDAPRRADDEPAPAPCDLAVVNDGVAEVVSLLDGLTGGAVPDGSALEVLAILTGCSAADPVLTAIGVLIGLGDALPDTGLDGLLPDLPGLVLPPEVIGLRPLLEPIVGPVCGAGSAAALLVFIFASHYPAPLDEVFLRTSNALLGLCAQLAPAPAPAPQ